MKYSTKKIFYLLVGLALTQPLLAKTNILFFAGSTRADSYNKKLAQEAASIASSMGADVTVLDLKDYPMPFYDEDLEKKQGMPKNAKRFRDAMIANQAVVIASPEYNASISAVLKNTLDWASRSPEGSSSREAFKGKKFALMSASPGKMGGARSLVPLQSILEAIGGEVIGKKVIIPHVYEKGILDRESIKEELRAELSELLSLIEN
jgi:chromate reductase